MEHQNMQTQSSLRIAFISTLSTPFIQDDLETLKRYYRTQVQIGSGIFHIFKIALSCFKSDIAFCWFASTYASFAVALMRLLGRRSVLVIGGVDVAKEKEIGYGIWLTPWKAACVRYALRSASAILAVDISLAKEAKQLAEYDGHNITVLPTGYDTQFWMPQGQKQSIVITVAAVSTKVQLQVKGIDILIEAARLLKDKDFCVVGTDRSMVAHLHPPPNIDFIPYIQRERLLPFYQRARIYCQPSRREGLSNALCEAMLCECIPVATNVGGNETAIGSSGILVPPKDPKLLADALGRAFSFSSEFGKKARERIVEKFPQERRQEALLKLLRSTQF
jgi:glycosyltransferase involved in cell wall biosynthesis